MFSAGEEAMKLLNSEEEMDAWLESFLTQMERTSSRTALCRLILSVERMEFSDHKFAADWQFVRFGKNESEILDKNKLPLQKMKITEFQRMILVSNSSFNNEDLCRSSVKAETGKWYLQGKPSKKIAEGGEAVVFSERFADFQTAVRVHIFDPFLFTSDFGSESLTWKAHFDKGLFLIAFGIKELSVGLIFFDFLNFLFEIFRLF